MMAYIRSVLSHIWGKQDALFPFFLFYCNICRISARMPGEKKKRKTCKCLNLLFWPLALCKLICVLFRSAVIACTFLSVLI